MRKQSLRRVLPVFVALGVACGTQGDGVGGFGPGPEPEPLVLTRLEVTPTDYALNVVRPGNRLQLTIRAYDQNGAPMGGTDAATYASSAPAIAAVSGSGVVTAAALGTAEITAALTVGGISRTASMTVTVYVARGHGAGVYDLSALITSFDPGWGEDLAGYRYTAILTLPEDLVPPMVGGTYADWWLIGPLGDSLKVADSGVVNSYLDYRGRLVIELVGAGDIIELSLIVGTLAPALIDGNWGCCGHISGTFTATRR